MPDIKTRETRSKGIKAIDKAAVAGERMRDAFIRTKDQASNLMDDGHASPAEYADDKIQYAMEDTAQAVGHEVERGTKKTVDRVKEARRQHKEIKKASKETGDTVKEGAKQVERGSTRVRRAQKQTIKSTNRAGKTIKQTATQFGFNEDQKEHLAALLEEGTSSMWAAVLYGVYGEDDQIVAVAASQIGNVGGMPYWSWYGFGSRVEWCACFVSWCANECGYIDIGVIPKFAGCVNGVNWFKERGQWADGSFEPAAGMIIFFDWDSPNGSSGPQDGLSDHVGIVEKVENGVVYTIEGNTGDSCARKSYSLGHYEILGYGIPAY